VKSKTAFDGTASARLRTQADCTKSGRPSASPAATESPLPRGAPVNGKGIREIWASPFGGKSRERFAAFGLWSLLPQEWESTCGGLDRCPAQASDPIQSGAIPASSGNPAHDWADAPSANVVNATLSPQATSTAVWVLAASRRCPSERWTPPQRRLLGRGCSAYVGHENRTLPSARRSGRVYWKCLVRPYSSTIKLWVLAGRICSDFRNSIIESRSYSLRFRKAWRAARASPECASTASRMVV
jgi:hypothetical protein